MKIPSAYRYYKLENLKTVCKIKPKNLSNLLGIFPDLMPTDLLKNILQRNLRMPLKNEKAKSEFIVAPILAEMWEQNQQFKPFSGLTFNIESSKGLKGICDFLISSKADISDLEEPVVCVFEAKSDALEDWYGQCGAEMYAARLFNEKKGNDIKIIYGAVTNGFTWQFLKLEEQTLFIDSQRYGTANLPQLLGAIQKIYNFYK
ncbi:MAG: hypothetical protein EAZ97_09485 [Bacteroidetes bacterium]|nr:MAG: hypothetical protein EAZ97_09485 [Bacteroidota bacterium]